MDINKIIDFLETDTIGVTFTEKGLKDLSLKGSKGEETIDLREVHEKGDKSSKEYLLLKETWSFLEKGSHQMELDLSAYTDFQRMVLQAVSHIKRGELCNYKDIAEIIGKPGGSQAVGSAVTKNTVSYFIPTHRVVSKKGLAKCKGGAGFLREKLLTLEGHDVEKLKGNHTCTRKKCCGETSD